MEITYYTSATESYARHTGKRNSAYLYQQIFLANKNLYLKKGIAKFSSCQ